MTVLKRLTRCRFYSRRVGRSDMPTKNNSTRLDAIENLFDNLCEFAKEEWPAMSIQERHCAKCKRRWGLWSEHHKNDVLYCQKCGNKLENLKKPNEYSYPHVFRLYTMMSYKFGSKAKQKKWREIVRATEHEFAFLDH